MLDIESNFDPTERGYYPDPDWDDAPCECAWHCSGYTPHERNPSGREKFLETAFILSLEALEVGTYANICRQDGNVLAAAAAQGRMDGLSCALVAFRKLWEVQP